MCRYRGPTPVSAHAQKLAKNIPVWPTWRAISLAIVTHTFLYAVSGKIKEIHPMMWILALLIIANQTGFIADVFGG